MPIVRSYSMHECDICGRTVNEYGIGENNRFYCPDCIREHHLIECSEDGCGKYLKPEEAYLSGRGFLCKEHWTERYSFCSECGALIQNKYSHKLSGGKKICANCFESKFFKCHNCGEVYPLIDAVNVEVDGQHIKICKICKVHNYTECPKCGKLKNIHDISDVEIRRKENGSERITACSSCLNEIANFCSHCGVWFEKSIHMHDDNNCCDRCYYHSEIIHSYNFKPKAEPRKTGNENAELLFGIENEIELKFNNPNRWRYEDCDNEEYLIETESGQIDVDYRRYIAYHIDTAIPGFFYQKHDGSIRFGMEIVSHPATLQFWRSQKDKIEELFNFLRTEECEGDGADTVGMHIHVSRNGMKRAHQNSFAAFVYSHGKKIEKLAGRKSNRYTKMIALPNSAANSDETKRFERVVIDNDDRYSAVNWRNRNTVELRMFQSTLNTAHFLANLEFAHALYHFSMERTVLECVNDESWKKFCSFVEENQYGYLMNLMIEKRIFETTA